MLNQIALYANILTMKGAEVTIGIRPSKETQEYKENTTIKPLQQADNYLYQVLSQSSEIPISSP
jgi:hypothetical protein